MSVCLPEPVMYLSYYNLELNELHGQTLLNS